MELAFALLKFGELDLSISLHSNQPVPQREWDLALDKLRKRATSGQLDPQRLRMLVVTDGGAPDALQRVQLNELWNGKQIKLALLIPGVNDTVKRGVITAITWSNPAVGTFTPDAFPRALEHLDLHAELPGVWDELCRLQQQMLPNQMMKRIAEHNALPAPARKP